MIDVQSVPSIVAAPPHSEDPFGGLSGMRLLQRAEERGHLAERPGELELEQPASACSSPRPVSYLDTSGASQAPGNQGGPRPANHLETSGAEAAGCAAEVDGDEAEALAAEVEAEFDLDDLLQRAEERVGMMHLVGRPGELEQRAPACSSPRPVSYPETRGARQPPGNQAEGCAAELNGSEADASAEEATGTDRSETEVDLDEIENWAASAQTEIDLDKAEAGAVEATSSSAKADAQEPEDACDCNYGDTFDGEAQELRGIAVGPTLTWRTNLCLADSTPVQQQTTMEKDVRPRRSRCLADSTWIQQTTTEKGVRPHRSRLTLDPKDPHTWPFSMKVQVFEEGFIPFAAVAKASEDKPSTHGLESESLHVEASLKASQLGA